MGCNAYSDENGEFEIEISSYDEPNNHWKKGHIRICGFTPNEGIILEVSKGEMR